MSKDAHIFFINSFFQLVAAKLILKKEDYNIIVCFDNKIYEAAVRIFDIDILLHTINDYPLIGRRLCIKKSISDTLNRINAKKYNRINFYMPTLSGARYNYYVSAAQQKYKNKASFRIIPDGTKNAVVYQLSSQKEKRIKKRSKSIIDRLFGIKYTSFTTDQYGITSSIISKIYTFDGFSHSYPEDKTETLPFIKPNNNKDTKNKKALIIGQTLVSSNHISDKTLNKISSKLKKYLESSKITEIYYAPHPSNKEESNFEMKPENAELFITDLPLELTLIENNFDAVIGIASTALISAKLIYGDSSNILSFFPDKVNSDYRDVYDEIYSHFKELNITIM